MNSQERNSSTLAVSGAEQTGIRLTTDGMCDVEIYILMRSCGVMMTSRLDRLLEPYALTPMECITMMALHSSPENLANPSELSEITGETRGNMTRICNELVLNGWMARVPNLQDRRRVDLSLTESGVALLEELSPKLRMNADDFWSGTFSETEKATLQRLLTRLLHHQKHSTTQLI